MLRRAALRFLYLALLPLLVLVALVLTSVVVVSRLGSGGRLWRPETWKKISYGSRYFRSSFRGRLGEVIDVIDVVRDLLIPLFLVPAVVCVAGGLIVHFLRVRVPHWLSAWLEGSSVSFVASVFPAGGRISFGGGAGLVLFACVALAALALVLSLYAWLAFALGEAIRVIMRYGGAATLFPDPGDAIPGGRLVLCQLSDLHITANGREPYEIEESSSAWPEGTPRPDTAELTGRLRRLVAEIAAMNPPLIALTGDMTDLGEEAQWDELEAALSGVPASSHVLMVPGNHDVAINVGTSPDPYLKKWAEREQRFIDVLTRVERGRFLPPLYIPARKRARRRLRAIAGLYPRRLQLEGGIRVFGLNSNRYRSRFVGSNAIGQIGGAQLRRLARALRRGSGPVIVLLHHHVARLAGPISLNDTFMIAMDGPRLLEMLAAYQQKNPKKNSALVLHGHKHLAFFGHYRSKTGGRVSVYAHPSSTLGHETDGHLDGVPRFAAIRLTEDGIWRVETHPLRPARGGAAAEMSSAAAAVS
ncbi:cAMP phosphodiesterase [Sorangium cellulosum]|uniref:cAMP phosphodiesterase n=1 Tax=Sorangium cellulosum TaxID=56 RepID=A0A2L0EUB2_SORCE|nr:metallophosphoesterase [Sorangium cellulosum]AUX42884.1 cAMP phosphodiesterase [Sorangium cellulosum]